MSLTVAVTLVVVAAVVGLAVGLTIASVRRPPAVPPRAYPPDGVPEAVDAVLQMLHSTVLVVGPVDRVLRATPGAHAAGLIRDDRVADPELATLTRSVLADGETRQLELALRRGEGQPRLLGVRAARVPAAGAEPGTDWLVLVLLEDRTMAARIDEMRRDFVANVSHELKTPVGAIALLAEALIEASDDADAVRRFAARVNRESRRLGELVQQIIELSRLQYDDPLESPEAVPVADVIGAAIDRVRVEAATRRIGLASGGAGDLMVLGSREQLTMALGNLVENAVTYSSTGGRVAVGVRRRDGQVEISVTDQGIGIPEAELERIFERFYRLDPARSRHTGGSGLGLAIVKHVAAAHGGQVSAWSVEGTGSTFTLRLPTYSPAPDRTGGRAVVPEASE